jgi:O-antigen/teichoic acid export membrane protein
MAPPPPVEQGAFRARLVVRGDIRQFAGKMVPWLAKGGLAAIDQALISGSNFIIGILLGRWLPETEYGTYATAFSIFLLLSLLFNSMVLEPMMVFGGSSYNDCLAGYMKSLLKLHAVIGGVVFCGLGLAAAGSWLFGHGGSMPVALLGVMIAAPCVLLFWLVRRAFYLNHSVASSAGGSIVYCTLVLGGLMVTHSFGYASSFISFVLMAVGALATSLFLLFRLRTVLDSTNPGPPFKEVLGRHWTYGRWAFAGAITRWIPAYIYFPLLGYFATMAQAGELKALLNLPAPIEQTYGAMSMLLLPYAARQMAGNATHKAGSLERRITLLCVAATLPFWLLVVPFPSLVFQFLYKGHYLQVAYLVPVIALSSLIWSATNGPVVVLRAMELPSSVFVAYSFSSAVAVLAGVPLTWKFGLPGVVWSIVVSNAAAYVVAWIYLRRKSNVVTKVPVLVDQ